MIVMQVCFLLTMRVRGARRRERVRFAYVIAAIMAARAGEGVKVGNDDLRNVCLPSTILDAPFRSVIRDLALLCNDFNTVLLAAVAVLVLYIPDLHLWRAAGSDRDNSWPSAVTLHDWALHRSQPELADLAKRAFDRLPWTTEKQLDAWLHSVKNECTSGSRDATKRILHPELKRVIAPLLAEASETIIARAARTHFQCPCRPFLHRDSHPLTPSQTSLTSWSRGSGPTFSRRSGRTGWRRCRMW